jgi:hypothetical protein
MARAAEEQVCVSVMGSFTGNAKNYVSERES